MKKILTSLIFCSLSLPVWAETNSNFGTADVDEEYLERLDESRPANPSVSHDYDESGLIDGPIKETEEGRQEELFDEYDYLDDDPGSDADIYSGEEEL